MEAWFPPSIYHHPKDWRRGFFRVLGESFFVFVFVFRLLIVGESLGLGDLMEGETEGDEGIRQQQKDISSMSPLGPDSELVPLRLI